MPGTSAALLAATESAPCKRARALAAAALVSGSGARPRAAAALAPGPRAAERAPRSGANPPAVRKSPGSDAAPLAATPWAPGTGAKRRAAATRAPGNKMLVLGLGVLLWAYARVVSGTGQHETSGGMVPNKFQNQVVELLGVQAEADAEILARAAAGARASGEISLQNPVTLWGEKARLQGVHVMMGAGRREFSAALAAQARGGVEAQAAAQERPHTAEAALEAEQQETAVLAQAEAEAVFLAGAEAAVRASGEARLQILMADLPCWRPSGARPRRFSRSARERLLRRRPLHQGRPPLVGRRAIWAL